MDRYNIDSPRLTRLDWAVLGAVLLFLLGGAAFCLFTIALESTWSA